MQSQLGIPELRHAKRVLCVQPHYDDNDIGAGGTLATLHDAGVEIIYLTVTDDLVGVVDVELSNRDAAAQLKQEQLRAGEVIGVNRQYWLGFPDAGEYDYFELRRQIIRYVRLLRPDFLFTCDPWLQYEAHHDHIQTGLAVSEASLLHAMRRLKVEPELDRRYEPYTINGVVFYFTQYPNTEFDITALHARKHHAIDFYRTQFTPQEMAQLHAELEVEELVPEVGAQPRYVERLKIVTPTQLHLHTATWRF